MMKMNFGMVATAVVALLVAAVGVSAQPPPWLNCSDVTYPENLCVPEQMVAQPDPLSSTGCVQVFKTCKVPPSCGSVSCQVYEYAGGWVASEKGQSCDETCPPELGVSCTVGPMNAIDTAAKVEMLSALLGFTCDPAKTVNFTGDTVAPLSPGTEVASETCFFTSAMDSSCADRDDGATRFCCCGVADACNNMQLLPATPTPTPTPTPAPIVGGWVIAQSSTEDCDSVCPFGFGCSPEGMRNLDNGLKMQTLGQNFLDDPTASNWSCASDSAVPTNVAPYFVYDTFPGPNGLASCYHRLAGDPSVNPPRCDVSPGDNLVPPEGANSRKVCCCGVATGPGSCEDLMPLQTAG